MAQVEELLTDEVLVSHPRSLLILASLTAVLSVQVRRFREGREGLRAGKEPRAVQMAVLGMIAVFYEGYPSGSGIWIPLLCLASTGLGALFLKWQPRRWLLYAYALAAALCLPLALAGFVLTAHRLAQVPIASPSPSLSFQASKVGLKEDKVLEQRGWNFVEEHIFQLNTIVENTKIAMYSLHLVLSPILSSHHPFPLLRLPSEGGRGNAVICLCGTLVLLVLNIREAAEGKVRRGYYVSNAPMGHQVHSLFPTPSLPNEAANCRRCSCPCR